MDSLFRYSFDSPKLVVGVLNNNVLAKYLFSEQIANVPIISMDNQQRVPIQNQAANGKLVANCWMRFYGE